MQESPAGLEHLKIDRKDPALIICLFNPFLLLHLHNTATSLFIDITTLDTP